MGFVITIVRDFFNSYMLFYWRQQEFHIVYSLLSSVMYRNRVKQKALDGES